MRAKRTDDAAMQHDGPTDRNRRPPGYFQKHSDKNKYPPTAEFLRYSPHHRVRMPQTALAFTFRSMVRYATWKECQKRTKSLNFVSFVATFRSRR
jgi:hypothetical protein